MFTNAKHSKLFPVVPLEYLIGFQNFIRILLLYHRQWRSQGARGRSPSNDQKVGVWEKPKFLGCSSKKERFPTFWRAWSQKNFSHFPFYPKNFSHFRTPIFFSLPSVFCPPPNEMTLATPLTIGFLSVIFSMPIFIRQWFLASHTLRFEPIPASHFAYPPSLIFSTSFLV